MGLLPTTPPPGPTDPEAWSSPLRGPWLTTVLGTLLLGAVVVLSTTGFASHLAYAPDLEDNAIVPRSGALDGLIVDWPTSWPWLYAVTQGLHVTLGFALLPLLLAKLWSVFPRLFEWPPVKGPGHAIERVAVLLLVGSAFFQLATGLANAQLWYPFRFNFVVAHFWGAWIFLAALSLHVLVKLPAMRRAVRTRGALAPLLHDRPEPPEPHGLAPPVPEPVVLSRRGLLGTVGLASGLLVLTSAGQSVGGPLRRVAVLAPRGGDLGFPVNKTAAQARITPAMAGAGWRLDLGDGLLLSREDLLAMDLATHRLPIACVEGWSATRTWTGVRLADLGERAGAPPGARLRVASLQERGVLRRATLTPGQAADRRSLLALLVDGADLSPDHGFPARIIVPGAPGVHCTKWVASLRWERS